MKIEYSDALEYMIELDIKAARSHSQMVSQIAKKINNEYAREIESFINLRSESDSVNNNDQISFYKTKNKSLDTSLAVSSAFDGDLLRQFCEWINSNIDSFGKTILEVGCDCGIISCYLGRLLPDAKIIAIDRCKEAIKNAKELAKRLYVHNVTFKASDVTEFESESFDTILSIRTMHENILKDFREEHFSPFDDLVEQFGHTINNYAQKLSNLIKDNGNLLSIERVKVNPLYYAWLNELRKNGLNVLFDDLETIEARELGYEHEFEVFKCIKLHNLVELSTSTITKAIFPELLNKEYLEEWEASIALSYLKKDLIIGFNIYDGDIQIAKRQAWTNKEDDSILFDQQVMNVGWQLSKHDKSLKNNVVETIKRDIVSDKNNGFSVKEFIIVDGKEKEKSNY